MIIGSIKRNHKLITQQSIHERHVSLEKEIHVTFTLKDSPPISNMVSSPVWSTCRTGGTFCLASMSRAFKSINTDSSERTNIHIHTPWSFNTDLCYLNPLEINLKINSFNVSDFYVYIVPYHSLY